MKILPNGIAVIESDTHISRWVEETGRLDHDEYFRSIVLPHLKPGDWIVDGGAFIGDHTIAYLEAVGLGGKVYAFEPNPIAYSCLCHNCPEAVTFNCGLSDREATVDYHYDENAGAGHVKFGNGDIKLVTLDSLNLERCDFLKLDIEGCEYEALLGAQKTMKVHEPVMWIEVNQGALERNGRNSEELLELVTNHLGYNVQAYPPERGPQYDILCIP